MALFAGCGDNADSAASPTDSAMTASASAQPTPSVDSASEGAIAMPGDWEIASEQYVQHLEKDGSFTEDFQGLTDFRTGTWKVDGDTISLIGGEGDTDKGKIVDKTLVFTLGTATRV